MKVNVSPNSLNEVMDKFLCTLLCGDSVNWPDASNVDFYDLLLEQISSQGVDSLVCHTLKLTPTWELLHEPFRGELLNRLKTATAFEMVRQRELLTLIGNLEQVGIYCLIIKGGALAYTHYPQPGLRSRCDTDIFIAPADIQKTADVFRGLGYQLKTQLYKSRQFSFSKSNTGGALSYDIHWRLNNRSRYARVLSYEEVVDGAVSIPELNGMLTLKPAHALLLACMHRASNPRRDSNRLIWLYDIHLLVSGMSVNELIEFAERAVDENIQAACRETIEKVQACFATVVADGVLEVLATPERALSLRGRLSNSQLALIFSDFGLLPGLRNKMKLVREYLFPPADYLLDRYRKKGWGWVPLLYFRYVFVGVFERVSLR